MKCSAHALEAIAVCAYCGRALCAQCRAPAPGERMICSADCAAALARADKAMEMILHQSVQNTRASAFYCYICGGLSLASSVVAWFMLPSPFLILFTAGCGIVLILSGVWYSRVARKRVS